MEHVDVDGRIRRVVDHPHAEGEVRRHQRADVERPGPAGNAPHDRAADRGESREAPVERHQRALLQPQVHPRRRGIQQADLDEKADQGQQRDDAGIEMRETKRPRYHGCADDHHERGDDAEQRIVVEESARNLQRQSHADRRERGGRREPA